MSTARTGGPRRRRIAGERRPGRPEGETMPAAPPSAPPPAVPPAPPPFTTPSSNERGNAAAPGPGGRDRGGWWGSRSSVLLLAGLLTVVVTLTALLALGVLGARSVGEVRAAQAADDAGQEATQAAERAAAAILAYDHKTLDADADQAARFMTADFAEQYAETFEKVVKPTAEENRATVTAVVQAASVVRASEDRVRVLLFVDQTTVSRANDNPQVALNRVEMVMRHEGDAWLVEEISSY